MVDGLAAPAYLYVLCHRHVHVHCRYTQYCYSSCHTGWKFNQTI